MRFLVSVGWIAVAFVLFSVDLSIASCTSDCPRGQNPYCISKGNNCYCRCIPNIQLPAPPATLANYTKYIQSQEGVDKSQLVNLDKILQKAIEESSQKPGTPVTFKVKVQDKENAPPKEVEYQIQASK